MDFRTGELIRRLERDLDALVTQVAALSVALTRAEERITELEQRAERRTQNGNRQRHTASRD